LATTIEISWHVEILFSKISCSGICDPKDDEREDWTTRSLDVESSKRLKKIGRGWVGIG